MANPLVKREPRGDKSTQRHRALRWAGIWANRLPLWDQELDGGLAHEAAGPIQGRQAARDMDFGGRRQVFLVDFR